MKRAPGRAFRVVVLGACALATGACATSRYTRSSVSAVPEGVKGRAGANAWIELQGLKVRLETLDRSAADEAPRPLELRLVFEPRELGYWFDPAQVTLRAADGTRFGALVPSHYRPLEPGSAFVLRFEATLARDARLELELGGLARGRKRLDPVRLPLERRSGRSIDRLYWLEAVGVVLMAPLAVAGGAP